MNLNIHSHFTPTILMLSLLLLSVSLWNPPAHAQEPVTTGYQLIESDDAQVQATGQWTIASEANASGGSYLRSSGASINDMLTLDFEGPFLEIVYAQAPGFGTLVIEIDGVVVRTLITASSTANSEGRATVDYLEPGRHQVRIYASDGVIGVDAFRIQSPEPATNQDTSAAINGYVRNGATPLAQVPVVIPGLARTCTDENGFFRFDGLTASQGYPLLAGSDEMGCDNALPDQNWALTWYPAAPRPSLGSLVEVSAAGVTRVDFDLAVGGRLGGIVVAAPGAATLADGRVFIFDAATQEKITSARLDCEGSACSYQVNGLPAPGEYHVKVEADGHATGWWRQDGRWSGSPDEADTIEITDTANDVNFQLLQGGSVAGQVNGANGPLANIPVEIYTPDNLLLGTCTDNTGRYTISGIPFDMPVTVGASFRDNWCDGPTNYVARWYDNVPTPRNATFITLDAGQPALESVDFTLELGGSVSGRVVAAEDTAQTLAGVVVCAFPYQQLPLDSTYFACTSSAENGNYTINRAPAGQVWVRAFPDGRLQHYYDRATNQVDARPITVRTDAGVPEVNFILPRAARISGSVFAEDGQTPAGGIYISDIDGEYGVCSRPDGSYEIYVPVTPVNDPHYLQARGGFCQPVGYPVQYYDQVKDLIGAQPLPVASIETQLEGVDFIRLLPNTPTTISPTTALFTRTPEYRWTAIEGSTHYGLFIQPVSPEGQTIEKWLAVEEVDCADNICRARPEDTSLRSNGRSSYRWSVQAYQDEGFGLGPRSSLRTFSVMPPPNPVNGAPAFTRFDGRVSLQWDAVDGAGWYQVYIGAADGEAVWSQWLGAEEIDCATQCALEPEVSLSNGSYTWYVRAYGPAGYSPWTDGTSLSLNATPPPVVTKQSPAPGEVLDTAEVTFAWQAVPVALNYQLAITGPDGYELDRAVSPGDADNCTESEGRCQLTLDLPASGSYTWYVRAINAAGGGLWDSAEPESYGGVEFEVAVPIPALAEKISPATNASLSTGQVSFHWREVAEAVAYRLAVTGPEDFSYDQLHMPGQGAQCSDGTCTVTVMLPANGPYTWYLQAQNAVGEGRWSQSEPDDFGGIEFEVNAGPVQVISKLEPAAGALVTENPVTFRWQADPNATGYEWAVVGPGEQTLEGSGFIGQGFDCEDGVCNLQLELPRNGDYTWYLRGTGPAGPGLWHPEEPENYGGVSFRLEVPPPPAPSLQAPADGATVSDRTATFRWDDVPHADYYELWIRSEERDVLRQWYAAETLACDGASCHLDLQPDLLPGGNYQWSVSAYSSAADVIGPSSAAFSFFRLEP